MKSAPLGDSDADGQPEFGDDLPPISESEGAVQADLLKLSLSFF